MSLKQLAKAQNNRKIIRKIRRKIIRKIRRKIIRKLDVIVHNPLASLDSCICILYGSP